MPNVPKKKPTYYSQFDSRWKDKPYTIDGDVKTETVGKSGCGPTCVAMMLSTWVAVTYPPNLCDLAIKLKDRTADNGTEWEFYKHIADRYHFKFEDTTDTNKALEALKDENCLVIASMGPSTFTKHGHFILLWKYENGKVFVNDPASVDRSNQSWDPSVFRKEAKHYFIFRNVR